VDCAYIFDDSSFFDRISVLRYSSGIHESRRTDSNVRFTSLNEKLPVIEWAIKQNPVKSIARATSVNLLNSGDTPEYSPRT